MKAKLTLLIYMSADNNLNSTAEDDLESLRKGSLYSDIQIIVQLDRWEFVDTQETIRYHIKRGDIEEIKRLGETNTGNPQILKKFIEESAKAYPSEKLIVVIWSHGTGVDDFDIYSANREHYFIHKEDIEKIAISFDDSAKDFLDNIELQKALDVDIPIDIIGFDACLMGMFEIAYQLRDNANYMVASQSVEPIYGWDYSRILEELDINIESSFIAEKLVKFYGDYYKHKPYDTTQSAYNLRFIDSVAKSLDSFSKVLLEHLEDRKDLKYSLLSSQLFNRNNNIDLIDFIKNIQSRVQIEQLEPYSKKLLEELDRFIIANYNMGHRVRDANGVSLYFPSKIRPFKETFEIYEKLDFSKDYPNWINLIRWYYTNSQSTTHKHS